MKKITNWNKHSKKMFPIAQRSKHLKKNEVIGMKKKDKG